MFICTSLIVEWIKGFLNGARPKIDKIIDKIAPPQICEGGVA